MATTFCLCMPKGSARTPLGPTELEIFEKDASNHKAHHKIKEHKPVMPDLYIKFHYNMLFYLRSGIIFLSLDPLIADILWTHWDLTYSGHTDI